MAGAVIAALPTALVYIFLGRFFIRGMLAGSAKGYTDYFCWNMCDQKTPL